MHTQGQQWHKLQQQQGKFLQIGQHRQGEQQQLGHKLYFGAYFLSGDKRRDRF